MGAAGKSGTDRPTLKASAKGRPISWTARKRPGAWRTCSKRRGPRWTGQRPAKVGRLEVLAPCSTGRNGPTSGRCSKRTGQRPEASTCSARSCRPTSGAKVESGSTCSKRRGGGEARSGGRPNVEGLHRGRPTSRRCSKRTGPTSRLERLGVLDDLAGGERLFDRRGCPLLGRSTACTRSGGRPVSGGSNGGGRRRRRRWRRGRVEARTGRSTRARIMHEANGNPGVAGRLPPVADYPCASVLNGCILGLFRNREADVGSGSARTTLAAHRSQRGQA